jgi:hypothetical protein
MAIIKFTEGFEYRGLKFGWRGTKLFRLPSKVNGREYRLRRLPVISLAKKIKGFRVARDKKSMAQVQRMTTKINVTIPKSECKGC